MSINAGTALGYLDLDTTKFKKGIQTALSDLQDFEKNSSSTATKITAVGSAMTTFGKTLTTAVSVPIAGIGIASSKLASDFEASMSEVKAISGATGKEFDALNAKAIEMGAKTKFSAGESAAAFKYMAMAGWDAQAMMDGIAGIMDLAAASGEDLATTSDIVTDALTAFGLQASDSAHFADILAKASSRANTNVSLMGETFKYVAPVAGALGYSAEDVAIAVGLMANSGIKGSQAGTALRASLSRLVKPTDTVAEYMEKYGLSLVDTDGSMKSLGTVMDDFRAKLGGLSEAEQAQAASAIFGQEAMSGMLAIINASDADYKKLTDEIYNASGASQEMAKVMMDNTLGAIEQLTGALESAGIMIGQKLTPYIRSFAEWIAELVDKFNNLSTETQDMIVKIGLIVGAIGPILLIVGQIVKLVGTLVSVFTTVKTAIGLFTGALTEGSMAATALAKVFSTVGKLFNPVTAVIMVLVGAFRTLWTTNEEFRNNIINIWSEIQNSLSSFIQAIANKFSSLGLSFSEIIESMRAVWEGFCNILAPLFEGAFSMVGAILDTVLKVILGFIDILIGVFTGDWSTLWQGVEQIFKSVWEGLINIVGIFVSSILDLTNNVLALFGTSWQSIWQNVSTFFINIWNNITSFVTEKIPQMIEDIISWFEELPYNIGVFLGNVYLAILDLGNSIMSWITEDLPQIINGIVEWFSTLPSKIWSWLSKVVSNIITWGSNIISQGKSAAGKFVNSVVTAIQNLPSKVWSILSKIPTKVVELGSKLYTAGKNAFNELWKGIKSIGSSILGWVSEFAGKIAGFVGKIVKGFNDVVSGANNARSAARSVDGSHANGLNYVPYDGYIAELHKGERVLTAEENRDYNKKSEDSNRGGDIFNFYNTKPTPYEYARQMKKAKEELLYGI